ncbi:hypothetical protein KCP73_17850 [Salmonella enterica subsp. enterica]|nr:hypothetical protein KCP73_17850 [Salmonella enterica subsp. enterica]
MPHRDITAIQQRGKFTAHTVQRPGALTATNSASAAAVRTKRSIAFDKMILKLLNISGGNEGVDTFRQLSLHKRNSRQAGVNGAIMGTSAYNPSDRYPSGRKRAACSNPAKLPEPLLLAFTRRYHHIFICRVTGPWNRL